MIEGAIDHLFSELGPMLDDFTLALAADGEITRARAIGTLDAGQRHIFGRLRRDGVRPSVFARKATLTQDSSDDTVYLLPQRVISVLAVEDSNDRHYRPVFSRLRADAAGYIVERRVATSGLGNVPVLRFWNTEPSSSATVYAWVVEEPPRLYVADGTYDATTGTFGSTSAYGFLVDTDDYLNGAEIGVVTGTVAGQVRLVSDYAGSTHAATVAAWTTTPTSADDISVLTTLPRPAWRTMILDAARRVLRVDEKFQDKAADILQELGDEYQTALRVLNQQALYDDSGPRQAEEWIV